MHFEVGKYIYAKDADQRFLSWCKENLVLDNPEYYKKERMGKWCGNTPKYIYLFEQNGGDVIVPFGCVMDLLKRFPEYSFWSRIKPPESFDYRSAINLYTYQEKAATEALNARNGVIVMPCGSGKTQTGLEIVSRLGMKALWLTHTQDLLNQSMNRAKSVFGCGGYGTITGGKVNIGPGLTFATVQTMSKLDLQKYRDTWGVIIVDECHKAIGSPTKVMQFYKVLSNLSCRYKFGLTATPKRADGLERSMFALIGDVICSVDRSAVKGTTCPVEVRTVETGYMPDLDMALAGDGTVNYAGLVDDLTHNEERFKLVLETISGLSNDNPILVLANRVEYLERLNKEYPKRSECLSAMGTSKAAKEKRKHALMALNNGELDCLFATYQLAAEGLDCPNLRYVVFATPEKNERVVEQASGRVARKADGKTHGTIIDFEDSFGMYKGWVKKRKSLYKKLGYDII